MEAINKLNQPVSNNEGQFQLGYMPFFDGVRGLGMLLIMFFHANAPILTGAFIFLNSFFVLSGFLITWLLIREWNQNHAISLKNFYTRRALRLLPALIAILVFYVTVSFLFLNNPIRHLEDALIILFYSSNWTRAFNLGRPAVMGHAWSLSVEEQFYILWPLILILLLWYIPSRSRILGIVSSGVVILCLYRIYMLVSGATIERLYNGLDTRGDSLLMGCALGILVSSNLIPKRKWLPTAANYAGIVASLGLLIIVLFADWRHPSTYYFVLFISDLFWSFIVLSFLLSGGGYLRKVFEQPFLVWVGRISYGLYLWHFLIFRGLQVKLGWDWPLVVSVGCILTFAVAVPSYYFLELPFLRLKTRFQQKQKVRVSPAVV